MYLALVMKIGQTKQQFSANNSNLRLGKDPGLELGRSASI
jgi:hypothetical protein